MASLNKKIEWRATLVKNAILSGGAAYWPGILKHIFTFHSKVGRHYLPYAIVKSEDNFILYQIGETQVWFPEAFNPSFLSLCYNEIFGQRVYENGPCRILPGDWVIDAGACEGFFSLYALNQGANVIAFEPIFEIAQALHKTLKDYIGIGRAKVFSLGLGEKAGRKKIFLHSINSGSATFNQEFIKDRDGDYNIHRSAEISIDTLDNIINDLQIPISFIKADVEGFERELLLGAKKTIGQYKPRLAICTYHLPNDFQEIPKIVRDFKAGYQMRLNGLYMHGW